MNTPLYGLERPHYCTPPRRQSLRDGEVRLASLPLASHRLSRLWQPDTGKGRLASQGWVNIN